MSEKLSSRTYKVVVGDIDISELHIVFSITKTLKKDPNECTIQVWNLSESSRQHLTDAKSLPVSVEAGYDGNNSLIYLGELRTAGSEIQGPDIVSTFTSGDGDRALAVARLSVPLGPKTPNDQVLLAISRTLGVGLGNAPAKALQIAGKSSFPVPTTLTGSASKQMTDFCRSNGLEWSIQDGKIQILDIGKSLDAQPYVIDSEAGLIGSPTVTYDSKTKTKIAKLETLMIPGLRPGIRIMMNSVFVRGLFRIESIDYDGDTHGQNWGQRISARSV